MSTQLVKIPSLDAEINQFRYKELFSGKNLGDLSQFFQMIRMCRPSRSRTERRFIEKFIEPTGAAPDDFGNYILRIGTAPVLWSCHTDTVHKRSGVQSVTAHGNMLKLAKKSPSNCLGADCTTGVWIMIKMIEAGTEGMYIFHRDEETGGSGSKHISKKTPELVEGLKFAIAFDRFGVDSVITRQFGGKCASQKFVDSIVPWLPGKYKSDTGGSFTDTANYTGLISECTNLSVGYFSQHTDNECQLLTHMFALKNAMIEMDVATLVADRTLEDTGWGRDYYASAWGSGSTFYDRWEPDREPKKDTYRSWDTIRDEDDITRYNKINSMLALVKRYPEELADVLEQEGYSTMDLLDEILRRKMG